MSDEQHTSWRDRFFGTAPAQTPESARTHDADPQHSAELGPDSTEAATTSVEDDVAHQPLVEHVDSDADTAVLDTHAAGDDSPVEPMVIAPSTLRGPSHSAAHPDESGRTDTPAAHGDAAASSLAREPEEGAGEPPALVEPRRPSFRLRRQAESGGIGEPGRADSGADDADGTGAGSHMGPGAGAGAAIAGSAGAGATAVARGRDRSDREFVEPEPTQAMATQPRDDEATRAIETHDDSPTKALPAQAAAEERTGRFGIIRDEVPASSIAVDDETARRAAGGTPIVLVEEPVPPRRKGARGVGFVVVLLATLIFALLFAAAFFAVGYLFDRRFDATETLETLWLRPSFLLPVITFFVAYLIVTLIVNRAGWWAHVLGAFIVALPVYAAELGGAFMESEGGWESYAALLGIGAQDLGPLVLSPLAVLAFVIAREVPVWVGGIVARRGQRAREGNRQAMDDFNAEHAERLAAYERARG